MTWRYDTYNSHSPRWQMSLTVPFSVICFLRVCLTSRHLFGFHTPYLSEKWPVKSLDFRQVQVSVVWISDIYCNCNVWVRGLFVVNDNSEMPQRFITPRIKLNGDFVTSCVKGKERLSQTHLATWHCILSWISFSSAWTCYRGTRPSTWSHLSAWGRPQPPWPQGTGWCWSSPRCLPAWPGPWQSRSIRCAKNVRQAFDRHGSCAIDFRPQACLEYSQPGQAKRSIFVSIGDL